MPINNNALAEQSNRSHKDIVNALISLVKFGNPSCPFKLTDLGYEIAALDKKIVTNSGEVKPDLVIYSRIWAVPSIFFEAKSGQNVERDQARRYAETDANLLKVLCPSGRKDVAYSTTVANAQRINLGIQLCGYSFPIIWFAPQHVGVMNTFADARINYKFSEYNNQVPFDMESVFPFIKYDHQSSIRDIARELAPQIVALIYQYREDATIDEVIAESNDFGWKLLDEAGKVELRRRVRVALRWMRGTSLGQYLQLVFRRGQDDVIGFRKQDRISGIQLDVLDEKLLEFLDELDNLN